MISVKNEINYKLKIKTEREGKVMMYDFMIFAADVYETGPSVWGVILIAVLIMLLGGVVCAIIYAIQNAKRRNGNDIQHNMVESKCPSCGETLVPGKKFCTKCGNKIAIEERE